MNSYPDKAFFKAHPLEKISAATIQDSALAFEYDDELHKKMVDAVLDNCKDNSRKDQLSADLSLIETLDSGEAIVKYMRQKHEVLANRDLFKKALIMQDEACPQIVRRYMTTAQEEYIDSAFRILAKADIKYAEMLFCHYREIRNPYAQSTACLLFGEHKMKDTVPLLLKEFTRFSNEYPNESFCQSPLLALYLICGKQ